MTASVKVNMIPYSFMISGKIVFQDLHLEPKLSYNQLIISGLRKMKHVKGTMKQQVSHSQNVPKVSSVNLVTLSRSQAQEKFAKNQRHLQEWNGLPVKINVNQAQCSINVLVPALSPLIAKRVVYTQLQNITL